MKPSAEIRIPLNILLKDEITLEFWIENLMTVQFLKITAQNSTYVLCDDITEIVLIKTI